MRGIVMTRSFWLAVFVALFGAPAHSQILIPVTLRSWVASDGYFPGANATANYVAVPGSYNNFFGWNLSGRAAASIVSATLYLNNTSTGVTGSGTYSIYDVSSSTASLLNPGNEVRAPSALAAFTDLGSGTSYGSISYSSSLAGQYAVINLNSSGIAALQAAWGSGYFNIGGAAAGTGMIFGGSAPIPTSQTYLSVVVPEPSVLSLLAFGLGGLAILRRRRD